jgi:eukaryotic-like serine/threonine-protein kinase
MARHRATGAPRRSPRRKPDDSLAETVDIGAARTPIAVPRGDDDATVSSAETAGRVTEDLAGPRSADAVERTPGEADASPARAAAPRYEDCGEIGRGGMGTVRRAFDRVLLRYVAMKLIEPSVVSSEIRALFVGEAQITGQLDHPNIVPVYEFGTLHGQQAYFTMKLVSGQTLSEVIRELHAKRLASEELERVLRIVLKVCEAVGFAHARGVVHRDLKPANIMIGTHGQVYVMDWGLGLLLAGRRAKGSGAGGGGEWTSVTTSAPHGHRSGLEGTVAYMAPEQASGRLDEVDARTDVFALGAILYEILTGRPPYRAPSVTEGLALAAEARIVPPQEVSSEPLPPGLCEIAMWAMQCDPGDRYQSVDALHAELERFLRGGGWFATRRFAPGAVIVREGEPGDAAYVIVDGTCEVYREAAGRRARVRTQGPGDVFGEAALLNAEPRTATVAAREEVTVKVITAHAFERELERSSWLSALVKQLAARFLALERNQRDEGGGA